MRSRAYRTFFLHRSAECSNMSAGHNYYDFQRRRESLSRAVGL